MKKYDPTYNLTVKTPNKTLTFSRPFASWFDEQGRFVALPFQQMLASSVPLIGTADPQRLASSEGKEGGAGGVEASGALEGGVARGPGRDLGGFEGCCFGGGGEEGRQEEEGLGVKGMAGLRNLFLCVSSTRAVTQENRSGKRGVLCVYQHVQ